MRFGIGFCGWPWLGRLRFFRLCLVLLVVFAPVFLYLSPVSPLVSFPAIVALCRCLQRPRALHAAAPWLACGCCLLRGSFANICVRPSCWACRRREMQYASQVPETRAKASFWSHCVKFSSACLGYRFHITWFLTLTRFPMIIFFKKIHLRTSFCPPPGGLKYYAHICLCPRRVQ